MDRKKKKEMRGLGKKTQNRYIFRGHRIAFIVSGMGIFIIAYINKLNIAYNTDKHTYICKYWLYKIQHKLS